MFEKLTNQDLVELLFYIEFYKTHDERRDKLMNIYTIQCRHLATIPDHKSKDFKDYRAIKMKTEKELSQIAEQHDQDIKYNILKKFTRKEFDYINIGLNTKSETLTQNQLELLYCFVMREFRLRSL